MTRLLRSWDAHQLRQEADGGSTLGNAGVAALDLAARDINAEVAALRLPYRVETFAEDTAQVPANALTKLVALARGVWQPASDEIKARAGFAPDAYALSVYDAAWVVALSFIDSHGRGDDPRRPVGAHRAIRELTCSSVDD